jgi:hypothetical protein
MISWKEDFGIYDFRLKLRIGERIITDGKKEEERKDDA